MFYVCSVYKDLPAFRNLLTEELCKPLMVEPKSTTKSTQSTNQNNEDTKENTADPDHDPLRVGPPRRPPAAYGYVTLCT